MSADLDSLDPSLASFARALLDVGRENGLVCTVTSTFRTYAEQKRLYDQFLAGRSAYPASPPGEGSHEFGWAFDMVCQPRGYLPDLGALWESWGGTWGGRWRNPDVIHFELPGASQRARELAGAGQAPPRSSGVSRALAAAADFIIARVPVIGVVELAANLYSLGYPQSEIARFLGGPVEYFFP